MAQPKLYFKNLDAIRFIAAFMVFLSHCGFKTLFGGFGANSLLHRFTFAISDGGGRSIHILCVERLSDYLFADLGV